MKNKHIEAEGTHGQENKQLKTYISIPLQLCSLPELVAPLVSYVDIKWYSLLPQPTIKGW